MNSSQRLLFMAGLARSGTTAFRRVLSAHPEVVLGMERYKRLWARAEEITTDLFVKERFFDFSDGLTNLTPDVGERWSINYAELEAKWDAATYVGDKMTTIRFDRLHELHPDAKFVFIVRDIDQVALSWERRASNPDDQGWPERSDGEASVERWNVALRRIRRAVRKHPDHAVVVEYHRLFSDPDAQSLKGVLAFLGLEWEPTIAGEFAAAHRQYVESVAGRDRTMPPELAKVVDEVADRDLWDAVIRLAV